MKSETIIISDIKLFSKKIVFGANTFSRKTNFDESLYYRLSVISKIKNCKIEEFREILGMSYVVTLDQTLTLTQTLV